MQKILDCIETGLWLLLSLALVVAAFTLVDGWRALSLPFETTNPEAFVLDGVWKLANGEPLYLPIKQPYYTLHVYNPLTYVPTGLLANYFDWDISATLYYGRLINYFFSLLTIVAVMACVWTQSRDWRAILIAGVGVLFYHEWAISEFFRLRPEPGALLFTFLAVAVFLSNCRFWIYISAVLAFIAFLFKQSFISAPIAMLFFLIIRKKNKEALQFLMLMSVLLALFFLVMYLLTGAGYYENTFLAMAVNKIDLVAPFKFFAPMVFSQCYGLLLATLIAGYVLYKTHKTGLFLTSYFVVALLWTFISAGKAGASLNYVLEWTIICLLVVAFAVVTGRRETRVATLAMLAALGVQVSYDTIKYTSLKLQHDKASVISLGSYTDLSYYVNKYQNEPGEKLIAHEKIAVHVGKPIAFDWYLLEILEENGLVDFSYLLNKIAAGAYSKVVFPKRMYSYRPKAESVLLRLYLAVQNGPYEQLYQDKNVIEWSYTPNKPIRRQSLLDGT